MFAVKGWSVSADKLKSEAAPGSAPPTDNATDGQQKDASKKRKRPQTNVTSSNVADLWEQVIEGKPARSNKKKPKAQVPGSNAVDAAQTQAAESAEKATSGPNVKKGSNVSGVESEGASQQDNRQVVPSGEGKKQKKQRSKGQTQTTDPAPPASKTHHQGAEGDQALEPDNERPGKRAKKNKKGGKDQDQTAEDEDERQQKSSKTSPAQTAGAQKALAQATAFVATPERKMTAMQLKMAQKLVSSRFRHLNELLYTEPSAKAFDILEKDPEMFTQYHEGFRRQVSVWPENPVDGYLEDIKRRGQIKGPQKGKSSGGGGRGYNSNSSATNFATEPLPRTTGTCTIADLGCGDAKLAAELKSKKKALRLDILSYDLQSPSPHVTRADIANLPLADGSVNVAIFCLALMGTNWLDFVEEAYRVLHWKGELWVAEIKSRLGHVGAPGGKRAPGGGNGGGGNSVVTHSVGNRKKAAAAGNNSNNPKKDPAAAAAAEKAQNAALAVEVDGAEDRRNETDVRAFVEALRKRGFVLQGEADLRNKMFVKMHFVKAAPATVGKNAFPADGAGAGAGAGGDRGAGGSRGGRDSRMGRVSAKFVEEDDTSKADEGGILKPCLYKIR